MSARRRAAALALAVAAALATATIARADEGDALTGTLKTLAARGSIRIGYRESAAPFSFLDPAGRPVGFALDLCRGIAAEAAEALNLAMLDDDAASWQQGLRPDFVKLTPDQRLPMVISGAVDVECGSTTATAARARDVAFSPVFFLAGTKLLAAADSGVDSLRDLAGQPVAVSAGTTNLDVLKALAARMPAAPVVVVAPDLGAAYDMLAAGRARALASDDILLSGLVATHPDGGRLRIVGDYLSFEPYAIVLRRDDPDFASLVRRGFERMAREGTLRAVYAKWFMRRLPTGETLNLPMSAQLTEMFRALGDPD